MMEQYIRFKKKGALNASNADIQGRGFRNDAWYSIMDVEGSRGRDSCRGNRVPKEVRLVGRQTRGRQDVRLFLARAN